MSRITTLIFFAFSVSICFSQNFSGLQNKQLVQTNDIATPLESLLTTVLSLGKGKGSIDSVLVTNDGKTQLTIKVWYTGFDKAFFTVSPINEKNQKLPQFTPAKFEQASSGSPVEITVLMKSDVEKSIAVKSPYLRFDIGKSANNSLGQVIIFNLNKNWINEFDAINAVINVTLSPVGTAARLKQNEAIDVIPAKSTRFNPNRLYSKPLNAGPKMQAMRAEGGDSSGTLKKYSFTEPHNNISGIWTPAVIFISTGGVLTKLIITDNSQIQAFGRSSPQDSNWGKATLVDLGNNNFSATFIRNLKRLTLSINYRDDQLIMERQSFEDSTGTIVNFEHATIFKKTQSLVDAGPQLYSLNDIGRRRSLDSNNKQVNKNPEGPDKNVLIDLSDDLSVDDQVVFQTPQDISNISMQVFADKNIASGIYYMFPSGYHLKWEAVPEPEKGYKFRILYGSQKNGDNADAGTDAPVRMSATITPGISSREKNFMKMLLKAAVPNFRDLRFLPLREKPQFTFQTTLGAQYNIPQNKITVETSTDLSSDIQIAWQTDANTKEFIQTVLTSGEGIGASVILKPADAEIIDQQVPALINLSDIRTLGKMNIEPVAWRSKKWRNPTPYPLRLNYLHVLKKETKGRRPIIYSWSMNGVVIPSQAQASFNSSIVPAWLDNEESVVMWIDYTVMDCSACDQKVIDGVTGGVSGSKAQQISFTIPPAVFDTLHASYFIITIRSNQVDPKGTEIKELPFLKITKGSNKEATAGPLFIPSGGSLSFEYRITMATADGEFYSSDTWSKAADKEVLLGKTMMKNLFKGIVPGIK